MAKRDNETAPTGPHTVYNQSSGTTGIQAGQINSSHVSVNLAPAADRPGDLRTAIAELRTQFDRARTAGKVDGELYSAAIEEINAAEAALREPGPKGRTKAVFAMKKLGGLVGDITDIAARVSLVTAGLNGLS